MPLYYNGDRIEEIKHGNETINEIYSSDFVLRYSNFTDRIYTEAGTYELKIPKGDYVIIARGGGGAGGESSSGGSYIGGCGGKGLLSMDTVHLDRGITADVIVGAGGLIWASGGNGGESGGNKSGAGGGGGHLSMVKDQNNGTELQTFYRIQQPIYCFDVSVDIGGGTVVYNAYSTKEELEVGDILISSTSAYGKKLFVVNSVRDYEIKVSPTNDRSAVYDAVRNESLDKEDVVYLEKYNKLVPDGNYDPFHFIAGDDYKGEKLYNENGEFVNCYYTKLTELGCCISQFEEDGSITVLHWLIGDEIGFDEYEVELTSKNVLLYAQGGGGGGGAGGVRNIGRYASGPAGGSGGGYYRLNENYEEESVAGQVGGASGGRYSAGGNGVAGNQDFALIYSGAGTSAHTGGGANAVGGGASGGGAGGSGNDSSASTGYSGGGAGGCMDAGGGQGGNFAYNFKTIPTGVADENLLYGIVGDYGKGGTTNTNGNCGFVIIKKIYKEPVIDLGGVTGSVSEIIDCGDITSEITETIDMGEI